MNFGPRIHLDVIPSHNHILVDPSRLPMDLIVPANDRVLLPFLLASVRVPHAAFRELVRNASRQDTAMCYDMRLTFARGVLVDKTQGWAVREAHRAFLDEVAQRHSVPFVELKDLDISIFYKRCKKTSVVISRTPDHTPMDVVLFNSDGDGVWYDISRPEDVLYVSNPEDPRYLFTCRYCCNRATSPRHFQKCGRCLQMRYCSKECQTKDWSVHRAAECKPHVDQ